MRTLIIILFLLIGVTAHATKYYVSTTGNNANPGTITEPWLTWAYAFTRPSPGDTVYFRGGVYMSTEGALGIRSINSGTASDTIKYFAYPGEEPILDCDNITAAISDLSHGIYTSVSYVHFKGLTIRNVWSFDDNDEPIAWRMSGIHTIIEECNTYNTHGTGFRTSSSSYEMYFINCDAWNHCDSLKAASPGNDGYGFGLWNTSNLTGSVYLQGCRAWNCGDDGFVIFSIGYVEIDKCWSFLNGQLQGGGDGYKIGFSPSTTVNEILRRRITNSIAAYNRHTGFNTNDLNDYPVNYMQLYNNIAYRNYDFTNDYSSEARGFILYNTADSDAAERERVLRNNISYGNTVNLGDVDFQLNSGALYTGSNNTWNGGVTVTNADFVSVDSTGITGARQADGSLPELNFLKLATGSDLIDAGVDVGLPYVNTAPDMGAYEYSTPDTETATDIITFAFPSQTGAATINATTHTVAIEVAYTATITNLTPTITLSYGATVIPASSTARNFTNPVPYTVTAEDGTTNQEWTVTVTQQAAPVDIDGGKILKFNGKIMKR